MPVVSVVRLLACCCLIGVVCGSAVAADKPAANPTPDEQLAQYFELATQQIERSNAEAFQDVTKWQEQQEHYRQQLAEMLGLSPEPERTPLQVTVTGTLEQDTVRIKNLHYQALPGLYVTANLYLPEQVDKPCPAILYVCGHSSNKKNGISYGNKFGYHQHGLWFARNGYVCLIIDTVQLGEFQGVHHGTYSKGMWWWNARGYTPAGVETWNGMRGIDYLQSLPEVDPERIGVTGRSGGGGYSWYIAAMDTRVKAAVPVAGITNMRNHIIDGCIAGHCDCMFMLNTYRWDFSQVAALIAPRPLLLTNTDKDRIFPLDGVMDVFWKTRQIYQGLGAGQNLGIAIAEGPHSDTQRLQVNAFEWFNRFLKQDTTQAQPTEKILKPEQLLVFQTLPEDERTSTIHDSFIPVAEPAVPENQQQWTQMKADWLQQLQRQSFAAWPEPSPAQAKVSAPQAAGTLTLAGKTVEQYSFSPQQPVVLTFGLLKSAEQPAASDRPVTLLLTRKPLAEETETVANWSTESGDLLLFAPRGLGDGAWSGDAKAQTHIRRRFALLGQTLDAMRLWDVCQLIQAVRQLPGYENRPVRIQATGDLAGLALYATLFVPHVQQLELTDLPTSHHAGPVFLNVLKIMDLPQALALAAEQTPLKLTKTDKTIATYAEQLRSVPGISLHPIEWQE